MSFNNNNNNGNLNSRPEDVERLLIELLNSNKPKVSRRAQSRLVNTTITTEDVEFLKAANDVIKMHQYRVDPTIRDILNRLQYANSPHGGLPLSRDYLNTLQSSLPPSNTQFTDPPTPTSFESGLRSSLNPSLVNQEFPRFSMDIFKPEEHFSGFNTQQQQQQQQQQQPSQFGFGVNQSNGVASNGNVNGSNSQSNAGPDKDLVNVLASRIKNMNANEQHGLISKITELLLSSAGGSEAASSRIDSQTTTQLQPSSVASTPASFGAPTPGYTTDLEPVYKAPKLTSLTTPNTLSIRGNDSSITLPSFRTLEEQTSMAASTSSSASAHPTSKNSKSHSHSHNHNDDSNPSDDGKPGRTYTCGKCGISFKRSSDLKRHEKIHLEVPPNICPLCHKGFARKDALKRHIDTLTCRRNRERLIAANGGEMPELPKNDD